MFNEKIQTGLIKQLNRELKSSQLYLSMASWVEKKGFEGISQFLYDHSNEERMHMLKLIRYVNKRGGDVILDNNISYKKIIYNNISLKELFQELFEHEKEISKKINNLVDISLQEKDYFTYNFLQWYLEEQVEEEALTKMILDKIKLIGEDKVGLYLFDQDIKHFQKKHNK
ncbi:ferritin [Blattabacterium cuenoti]|uniref:ferritin n=1 Tax=Blattabacterium cuenoti TaxID=1653831 RepID=UPI00163BE818|nr:ferritin [Blattabacterium cuenoti]